MGANDKLVTLQRLTTAVNAIATQVRNNYVALNDTDYLNTIASISKNGTALSIDVNKNVDISIAPSDVIVTPAAGNDPAVTLADVLATLSTTSNVEDAIAAAISAVYKPAGSVATVSGLPVLASSVLGNVYDFTAAFETTSDFVEGAGKSYPAGTNVVVVDTDTTGENPTYKFDVLAGFVDLGDYLTNADAGAGINITAQNKIEIDPSKFTTEGLDLTVSSNTVGLSLSASTVASLAKADSAIQTVTDGDGITATTVGDTVTVAANIKADSAEVGSEFTNLLKVDDSGALYVDSEEVQGALTPVDTNGIDLAISNGEITATPNVSNISGNLLQVVAATEGADAHTAGFAVVLEFATDEEVTAIVNAAFGAEEEEDPDEPTIGD